MKHSMSRRSAIQRLAWMTAGPALVSHGAAVAAGDLESGLVAWWSFEPRGKGKVPDRSGKGHVLDVGDARSAPGAVGQALVFPGTVQTPPSTPMTPDLVFSKAVSVACWLRADRDLSGVEGAGIVYSDSTWLLRISGGMHPSFHVFTDGWGPVMCPNSIRPGGWYHFVGVYDGAEMRLYANGRLAARRKRTGALNRPRSDRIILGRQVDPFVGAIDEVRIYRHALSDREAAALFETDRGHLNRGVAVGSFAEPFESLFGQTRNRPTPEPRSALLPEADFSFAVFTDTHIGTRGEEHHYCHNWRVEEVVRQINALKPDLAVNCGDIITTFPDRDGYAEQCRYASSVNRRFNVPLHLVPGNHDIGDQAPMRVFGPGEDEKRRIKPEFIQAYRKYFGRDYYAFTAGGCRFLVVNGSLFNSGLPDEKAQWTMLERELAGADKARFRFAFVHNPPFWRAPTEPQEGNYEPLYEPVRSRFLDLLAANRVDALFCGHTHFPFTNSYRGMPIITLNSTTFNRNFPEDGTSLSGQAEIYDPYKPGFLLVRLTGDRFHTMWVNTYWRVPDPPPSMKSRVGWRLLGAPADAGTGPTVLNPRVKLPHTVLRQRRNRAGRVRTSSTAYDIAWRLPEQLGSAGALAAVNWEADADRVRETLALRPVHGVHTVWPVPATGPASVAALDLLRTLKPAPDILVENGRLSAPEAPLGSWQTVGTPVDWARDCDRLRAQLHSPRLVLGRLPLPTGLPELHLLEGAASALDGHADGLAVWTVGGAGPPEDGLFPALEQADAICRACHLDLWLDAGGVQSVPEPDRSAYFLRLLALALGKGVPVTWWGGPEGRGGLLDRHLDPTPSFFAAQLWNSLTRGARDVRLAHEKDRFTLDWRSADGKRRRARWRAGSEFGAIAVAGSLPDWARQVVDPLHNRELRIEHSRVPLTDWPLVAIEI